MRTEEILKERFSDYEKVTNFELFEVIHDYENLRLLINVVYNGSKFPFTRFYDEKINTKKVFGFKYKCLESEWTGIHFNEKLKMYVLDEELNEYYNSLNDKKYNDIINILKK